MFAKEGAFCELLATRGQKLQILFLKRGLSYGWGSHFLVIIIMICQDFNALHKMPSIFLTSLNYLQQLSYFQPQIYLTDSPGVFYYSFEE